jgi:hypothetical protein
MPLEIADMYRNSSKLLAAVDAVGIHGGGTGREVGGHPKAVHLLKVGSLLIVEVGSVLFAENDLRVTVPSLCGAFLSAGWLLPRIFISITQKESLARLLSCNDLSSNILLDYCLKQFRLCR